MIETRRPASSATRLPKLLILLLAITAAVVVADIYYNQAILDLLGRYFHRDAGAVAWVATATQAGYAAGLLLILPLGDSIDRKKMIVVTVWLAAATAVAIACTQQLELLVAESFVFGGVSVAPQLAIPYAAGVVAPEIRGRVVGLIMGGLLAGILGGRVFAGLVTPRAPWQFIFFAAAGLLIVLSVVLLLALPAQPAAHRLSYATLLGSLPRLLMSESVLWRHALVGAAGFASFSVFWTTLSFHLHRLKLTEAFISLFGAVAISGALVAPVAGRMAERHSALLVNGGFLLLASAGFAMLGWSDRSPVLIIAAAVFVLDAGVQGSHISNLARIYQLEQKLHSRINAVYMVILFTGGAIGSAVGVRAWLAFGWVGVCVVGTTLPLLGIVCLLPETTRIRSTRSDTQPGH